MQRQHHQNNSERDPSSLSSSGSSQGTHEELSSWANDPPNPRFSDMASAQNSSSSHLLEPGGGGVVEDRRATVFESLASLGEGLDECVKKHTPLRNSTSGPQLMERSGIVARPPAPPPHMDHIE